MHSPTFTTWTLRPNWLIDDWFWHVCFSLFSFSPLWGHELKFWLSESYFYRIVSYIILLLKVIHALVVVISCGLCCCRRFWWPERWRFLSNRSCFHWSFWHHCRQSILGGRARTMDWCQELRSCRVQALNFFLRPSSRASRKMPRLPRLAHNAPVMQATMTKRTAKKCQCHHDKTPKTIPSAIPPRWLRLFIQAPFTRPKMFGTARMKKVRVPKKLVRHG